MPKALALDDAGNLYVGDSRNARIRRITPDGVITTIAAMQASPALAAPVITTTAAPPAADRRNAEVAGPPVYQHALRPNLPGVLSNRQGQEASGSFALASGISVTHIRWYGYYPTVDLNPRTRRIDFRISIYPSASVAPGPKALVSRIVDAAVQATNQKVGGPTSTSTRWIYQFEADFQATLPAGDSYWISISDSDNDTPTWYWSRNAFYGGFDQTAFSLFGKMLN